MPLTHFSIEHMVEGSDIKDVRISTLLWEQSTFIAREQIKNAL